MSALLDCSNRDQKEKADGNMFRPRVNAVFEEASRCALVIAVAGAGYGKTQAARAFMRGQDALVTWVTLTENDNLCSRFWENFTYAISMRDAKLARRLRSFGFPETDRRFARYASLPQDAGYADKREFFVFDDVHSISNRQVLKFIERSVLAPFPNFCTFLLSRQEPQINMASLVAKGKVKLIPEEVFRFTEEEMYAFFQQEGVPLSPRSLSRVFSETGGWAFAIQLLGMALKRMPAAEKESLEREALRVMKQNIFKMMEREAFVDFPENVQKNMVKLSLIPRLPIEALSEFFGESGENETFFASGPQIASFVWRDSLSGSYKVHPLYLEFLTGKQNLLTGEEKREVYRRVADWCLSHNFLLYALDYCSKLRDYARMLEIFMSCPFFLPRDTSEFFLRVLEGLEPLDCERIAPCALMKYAFTPRILMDLGRYKEAEALALEAIAHWESSDLPFAGVVLYSCHNNLGYIRTHTCLKAHQYDIDRHFQKAVGIFQKDPIPSRLSGPLGCTRVRSFACIVGVGARPEEFEHFLRATRNMVTCLQIMLPGFYYGYDDLAECELAFFRSQAGKARFSAQRAISKAQSQNQYDIESAAFFYLFRSMLTEGDFKLSGGLLDQFRKRTQNPKFLNGQLFYDLITIWFYTQIGLPFLVPAWLQSLPPVEESDSSVPLLECLIHSSYLISDKKYNEALILLHSARRAEVDGEFLFGELICCLLRAVARQKNGDETGALADFEQAYSHSQNGELEMPFVERGRDICELVSLALRREACAIPSNWLKSLDLRAAAYAKKVAIVTAAFKKQNNIDDKIELSEREAQLIKDLYQGLSRQEIAATRYLSINTVKTEIKTLYLKLGVESSIEAVRIAIERGWV